MSKSKDQPLRLTVSKDRIVISVGLSVFAEGCERSEDWDFVEDITDEEQFAKDVVRELMREDEQGNTPLYFLFDKMARKAVENGSVGVG